jgi:hypothetical protein
MTARRVGKCGQAAWTPWLGCHVLLRDRGPSRSCAASCRPDPAAKIDAKRFLQTGDELWPLGDGEAQAAPAEPPDTGPFHAPVSSTPGHVVASRLPGVALTTAAGPAGRPYWAPNSADPWLPVDQTRQELLCVPEHQSVRQNLLLRVQGAEAGMNSRRMAITGPSAVNAPARTFSRARAIGTSYGVAVLRASPPDVVGVLQRRPPVHGGELGADVRRSESGGEPHAGACLELGERDLEDPEIVERPDSRTAHAQSQARCFPLC